MLNRLQAWSYSNTGQQYRLLTFSIRNQIFAIDMGDVISLEREQKTALSEIAQNWVEFQGQKVTVIDLPMRLALIQHDTHEQTCIVFVRCKRGIFGLILHSLPESVSLKAKLNPRTSLPRSFGQGQYAKICSRLVPDSEDKVNGKEKAEEINLLDIEKLTVSDKLASQKQSGPAGLKAGKSNVSLLTLSNKRKQLTGANKPQQKVSQQIVSQQIVIVESEQALSSLRTYIASFEKLQGCLQPLTDYQRKVLKEFQCKLSQRPSIEDWYQNLYGKNQLKNCSRSDLSRVVATQYQGGTQCLGVLDTLLAGEFKSRQEYQGQLQTLIAGLKLIARGYEQLIEIFCQSSKLEKLKT